MRRIRDVLRLANELNMSQRQIESSLNISRASIADYLIRAQHAGLPWPLPLNMGDAELEQLLFPVARQQESRKPEPDWSAVHEALKQKGSTLQVLHGEYMAEHPAGMAYSHFCNRHRRFTKSLKRYLRQVHIAGDKVFVDYAGPTVKIHDLKTGDVREAQIFVGVLGASNLIYADAVWNQRKENWLASHARMFEYFGGVPTMVVCDNLKSAVTKASRTEPLIHPSYLDLGNHYGVAIFPARPYKPKDKSKAEGGVLIVERWIYFRLRKRIFTSLTELNVAIRELLEDLNNRPFQKMPGTRRSAFESLDRPALKPLPAYPYVYREFRKLRVGFDYHIEIDRHFYSVPYALIRKEVEAILTAGTVEIQHGGKKVASHTRIYEAGKSTHDFHMAVADRHFAQWSAEHDLDWALSIGTHTHAFLQVVFSKAPHRDMSYRWANSLKSLSREYGIERLELACKRALDIGATESRNVKSILKNNLDRIVGTDSPTGQEAAFDHDNIRGPDYYH